MSPRFDEAWDAAGRLAEEISDAGHDVLMLRDLLGRISMVLDDRQHEVAVSDVESYTRTSKAALGRYASATPVLRGTTLFLPNQAFDDRDSYIRRERSHDTGRITVLERSAVGTDWDRVSDDPPTRRVSLYGYKGGVGRSLATTMLARHLAQQGRCILVIDLDLESPGVATIIEDESNFPLFGLTDHLVESAVGNEEGLEITARSRRIEGQENGEVWFCPARGRPRAGYDYLAKLDRAYIDVSAPETPGDNSFGHRLAAAVYAAEKQVGARSRTPDAVLLDCRSGVHDVAAIALTQLSDLNLLFAADNRQTWLGYGDLFARWASVGKAQLMRDRLRMVASMVPREQSEYLERFGDRAQSVFAETLYDNVPAAAETIDAYNFSTEDRDAPHWPLPILFTAELVGLDVSTERTWADSDIVGAAYHEFLSGAEELIFGADGG